MGCRETCVSMGGANIWQGARFSVASPGKAEEAVQITLRTNADINRFGSIEASSNDVHFEHLIHSRTSAKLPTSRPRITPLNRSLDLQMD